MKTLCVCKKRYYLLKAPLRMLPDAKCATQSGRSVGAKSVEASIVLKITHQSIINYFGKGVLC